MTLPTLPLLLPPLTFPFTSSSLFRECVENNAGVVRDRVGSFPAERSDAADVEADSDSAGTRGRGGSVVVEADGDVGGDDVRFSNRVSRARVNPPVDLTVERDEELE